MYEQDARAETGRFYAIAVKLKQRVYGEILAECKGKSVLLYGCGKDGLTFDCARNGATAIGIDISEVAVKIARLKAEKEALVGVRFDVMDAEAMSFPADSFDIVHGTAILHHLDIETAFREIARVLRPDGEAWFIEPLGHNPLINWYRASTPHLRTSDEHPLTMEDIAIARKHFSTVTVSYHFLAALGAIPFNGTIIFAPFCATLNACDRLLFALFPFLRKYAWMVVLKLARPEKGQ
jgi:ubiquinone/menaquinone biosynthesis C-methylase UbiE